MSYDVYLRAKVCETCGHRGPEPDLPDPTYNLTPIFDLALTGEDLPNKQISEMEVVLLGKETDRPRGLRLLHGKKAKDTIVWMVKGLNQMQMGENKARFIELEPPNKWGTLPDAIHVFERLIEAAREYPESIWEVR